MATAWRELAPAVETRIEGQLTGLTPPPVYRSMAPINADLPYIIISPVIQVEEQVFDDDAETTEVDFDIAIYSSKTTANADTAHLGYVDEVINAVRRWTPTMTNWNSSPIRSDDQTPMQILEDSIQTVCSFTVVMERK